MKQKHMITYLHSADSDLSWFLGYIYGSNIYLAVALPGRQEMPLYS